MLESHPLALVAISVFALAAYGVGRLFDACSRRLRRPRAHGR